MANRYDAAKAYFNSVTGESHSAYADAATAYYEYVLANGSPVGTLPAPTASVRGGVLQAANIVSLTDSSGGTSGGNTVPAVPAATAATTDTTAASLTSTNAAITALKNDVATLSAKLNAALAALDTAGVTA